MRCAECQSYQDTVIDSRESADGRVIRRRRTCKSCGSRWTTHEESVGAKPRASKAELKEAIEGLHREVCNLMSQIEERE